MQILFDDTSRLLGLMIRAATLRHQVLSQNIANIDTPGYRPVDISFNEELRMASEGAVPPARVVTATMTAETPGSQRYDGNAVDIDRQMAKMAQNALWHNALIQIMNSRMNFLRTAIKGG